MADERERGDGESRERATGTIAENARQEPQDAI